jgi:lipoprotein-anchoring transpeptidase ErfK/SrfK
MRRVTIALGLATALLSGEAGAQSRPYAAMYNQPAPYGGGFIEMLMTGRDPGPGIRTLRSGRDPYAAGADRQVPVVRRYAGRPADPAAEIVRAAPDPRYARQMVSYDGREPAGTIVIDTPSKFLYLVQGNGQALRYGIGVGRPGFAWAGVKTVTMKREWPDWTPPAEMLKRRPDLPRHMQGGPENPLGARALYLGSSLYRIHGTNEPSTIGQNVSSGCIRMMNEDVMDLYERVRVGTRVIVS